VLDESRYVALEEDLLDRLGECSESIGVCYENVRYSKKRLRYIVDMVERRRVYFHVYHNGMEMGELNEGCLLCFWLLKLYPFFDREDSDCNVNLVFALKLFTDAVSYVAAKNGRVANYTEDTIDHLIHAFTFRDLSKEAVMALAVSLIR